MSVPQGDRRAGPSLAAFNFDASWGQRALRETYRASMGEERAPLALPQTCRPGAHAGGRETVHGSMRAMGVHAHVHLCGSAGLGSPQAA